jgi:hypothetical protein
MKFIFLDEMTMKARNLDTNSVHVFDHFNKSITDDKLKHIGDIDSVKVMRYESSKDIIDFLVKDSKRIGFSACNVLKTKIGEVLEIGNWYIIPEERRQDLGYKFLYFLKNVMKQKILFGNIHPRSTHDFLKKQHNLKRFKISWYNLKNGEVEPFENDKYGMIEPTDWQVLVESDDNQLFNQFKTEVPSLKNSYDWLFKDIESLL